MFNFLDIFRVISFIILVQMIFELFQITRFA